LRSPRRGRVARRSPSIAIVGRRLLGRFLLGDTRRALSCAATPLSWQRISPGASGFREREQAAALRAGACRLAAGCKQSTRVGLVATSRSVSDSDEIVLRGVQEQRESAARLPRLPKGRIDPPIGGPLPLRPDRLLEGCKHGFARVAAPVVKRSSREFGGNGCRVRTRSSSAAAGATVQPLDLAAKAGAGAVERRVLTSDLLDRDVALKQRVGLPDPPALPFGCESARVPESSPGHVVGRLREPVEAGGRSQLREFLAAQGLARSEQRSSARCLERGRAGVLPRRQPPPSGPVARARRMRTGERPALFRSRHRYCADSAVCPPCRE
jgi:hypothetical protein